MSDYITINRIYRVFLILTAVISLTIALKKTLCCTKSVIDIFCWVLLANTLSYTFGPVSLSYNTLNLVFLEFSFSTILLVFFRYEKIGTFVFILKYVGLPFTIAILTINKPTTGILFTGFLLLDIVYSKRKDLLAGIRTAGFIAFWIMVYSSLIFYSMYGSEIPNIIRLLITKQFYAGDGHLNISFLLNQIFFKPLIDQRGLFLFTLSYLAIFYLQKKAILNVKFSRLLFIAVTVLSMWFYHNTYYKGYAGSQFFYAYFCSFVIFYFDKIRLRMSKMSTFEKRALSWLVVLPFIGFFGSDVPFYLGVLNVLGFHLLIFFIFFQDNDFTNLYPFSLLTVLFTFFVLLINPYSNPNIFKQNNQISFTKGKINVSQPVFEEYKALKNMLPFIAPEDILINIGTPVGSLYLCDLTSFYTIYFNSVFFNSGYLKLIQNVPITKPITLIYYKQNGDSLSYAKIKTEFISFLSEKDFELKTVTRTKKYDLYKFSH